MMELCVTHVDNSQYLGSDGNVLSVQIMICALSVTMVINII